MIASYETLKQNALNSLKGKWGLAIGALLVYLIIALPLQMIPKAGSVIGLLIGGPFSVGIATFYLNLSKDNNPKIADIFSGFNNFVPALTTYLLMLLYVVLWALLLIIPGIIAAISYSQVFFIRAEEPDLSSAEVLKKSKQMMDGHKARYFVLMLTFLGWFLLSALTLFIGLLWLGPYYQLTMTKFYENLRGDKTDDISIPNILDAN